MTVPEIPDVIHGRCSYKDKKNSSPNNGSKATPGDGGTPECGTLSEEKKKRNKTSSGLLGRIVKHKMLLSFAGVVSIAVIGVIMYFIPLTNASVPNDKIPEVPFFELMKEKYPKQPPETFRLFSKIIKQSKKSTRKDDFNNVFTLLHNCTPTIANSIADEMALFAAKEFGKPQEIYKLNGGSLPDDFASASFLGNLKVSLVNIGSMVVCDFDKIPSDLVRKFHSICDKYTPFVESHVAFILVLETDLAHKQDMSHLELKNLAVATIEGRWKDLENSSLKPLVTRLTDLVLYIKS